VYRCRVRTRGADFEAVLKVARDARTNDLLSNEAGILRRLHAAPGAARFAPFLPRVVEQLTLEGAGPGDAPRLATVLATHPDIRSPADELYTLEDVRAAYPAGLGGRDAAWVWRRVLHVLGFAHASGVAHGAVLPPHVLVEPAGHKLVLIGWTCAAHPGTRAPHLPASFAGGYGPWYRRAGATRRPATPALDVALAARCMVELLGGDPVEPACPPAVEPALERYFERCIALEPGAAVDAWRLLAEFDRLIEILWGPRRFRPLHMPARRAPCT
jgi:hypothetical protein